MEKVNFLIVGAQKGGTTSLFEYLSRHDQIFTPSNKELDFFSNDKNFSKGINFYHSFFLESSTSDLLGEASPQYMYFPKTARRIFEYSSEIKIIMCLRDPADRAFSHFRMNKRRLKEKDSFQIAVNKQLKIFQESGRFDDDMEFNYLGLGLYGEIIENYLRYFDPSQIKIVWSESLSKDRENTVGEVLNFLGATSGISGINEADLKNDFHIGGDQRFPFLYNAFVKSSKLSPTLNSVIKKILGRARVYRWLFKIETEFFVKRKTESIDAKTRQILKDFYKDDAKKISSLLKVKVPWE